MRTKKITLALVSLIFFSCSTSKKVVSNKSVMKRKYLNGFYFSSKSKLKNEKNFSLDYNSVKLASKDLPDLENNYLKNDFLYSNDVNNKNDNKYVANNPDFTFVESNENIQASTSKFDLNLLNNKKISNNPTTIENEKSIIMGKIIKSRVTSSGGKGKSIASLVLGILSILVCWLPYVGLILGIIGVILGFLGLKKEDAKGLSIAGIVCSIVGIVLGLWPLIFAAALFTL